MNLFSRFRRLVPKAPLRVGTVLYYEDGVADIEASPIAPVLVESCPTRIFLANERAIEPQITAVYERFGLNSRQIEIIAG